MTAYNDIDWQLLELDGILIIIIIIIIIIINSSYIASYVVVGDVELQMEYARRQWL